MTLTDRTTNKKPSVRKLHLSELSVREVTWTPRPKYYRLLSVLMASLQTLTEGLIAKDNTYWTHRTWRNQLVLIWNLSLLLMVLEGAMHMTGGEKRAVSPSWWSSIVNRLVRYTYWFNSDMNVVWPTSHYLMGVKACSTRWNLWIERSQALGENLLLLFC